MIQQENRELSGESELFQGADTVYTTDDPENALFRIAQDTPDDPEPSRARNRRNPTGIKMTSSVRKDVEGKIAFMLLTTGNAWQLADPTCGTVLVEQTADIASKLTPILCQSPAVVEWFQKGTSLMMYVDLLMALGPLAAAVYRHHFSGAEPMPEVPYSDEYYGVR
jgi:hypothetical protein